MTSCRSLLSGRGDGVREGVQTSISMPETLAAGRGALPGGGEQDPESSRSDQVHTIKRLSNANSGAPRSVASRTAASAPEPSAS